MPWWPIYVFLVNKFFERKTDYKTLLNFSIVYVMRIYKKS
jgi:hypothetical protein